MVRQSHSTSPLTDWSAVSPNNLQILVLEPFVINPVCCMEGMEKAWKPFRPYHESSILMRDCFFSHRMKQSSVRDTAKNMLLYACLPILIHAELNRTRLLGPNSKVDPGNRSILGADPCSWLKMLPPANWKDRELDGSYTNLSFTCGPFRSVKLCMAFNMTLN